MTQKKKCLYCGKEFVPTHGRQKYCCEKCRIKYRNESQGSIRAANLKEEIRICEYCGKEFKPKTVLSKCCSKECNQKLWQQIRKEETLKRKALMKCEVCGKPLGKYHSSVYCSKKCSYEAKKRMLRESKPEKPKKLTKPKLSISEINRRALAEHLSYGEYVMKYGV